MSHLLKQSSARDERSQSIENMLSSSIQRAKEKIQLIQSGNLQGAHSLRQSNASQPLEQSQYSNACPVPRMPLNQPPTQFGSSRNSQYSNQKPNSLPQFNYQTASNELLSQSTVVSQSSSLPSSSQPLAMAMRALQARIGELEKSLESAEKGRANQQEQLANLQDQKRLILTNLDETKRKLGHAQATMKTSKQQLKEAQETLNRQREWLAESQAAKQSLQLQIKKITREFETPLKEVQKPSTIFHPSHSTQTDETYLKSVEPIPMAMTNSSKISKSEVLYRAKLEDLSTHERSLFDKDAQFACRQAKITSQQVQLSTREAQLVVKQSQLNSRIIKITQNTKQQHHQNEVQSIQRLTELTLSLQTLAKSERDLRLKLSEVESQLDQVVRERDHLIEENQRLIQQASGTATKQLVSSPGLTPPSYCLETADPQSSNCNQSAGNACANSHHTSSMLLGSQLAHVRSRLKGQERCSQYYASQYFELYKVLEAVNQLIKKTMNVPPGVKQCKLCWGFQQFQYLSGCIGENVFLEINMNFIKLAIILIIIHPNAINCLVLIRGDRLHSQLLRTQRSIATGIFPATVRGRSRSIGTSKSGKKQRGSRDSINKTNSGQKGMHNRTINGVNHSQTYHMSPSSHSNGSLSKKIPYQSQQQLATIAAYQHNYAYNTHLNNSKLNTSNRSNHSNASNRSRNSSVSNRSHSRSITKSNKGKKVIFTTNNVLSNNMNNGSNTYIRNQLRQLRAQYKQLVGQVDNAQNQNNRQIIRGKLNQLAVQIQKKSQGVKLIPNAY